MKLNRERKRYIKNKTLSQIALCINGERSDFDEFCCRAFWSGEEFERLTEEEKDYIDTIMIKEANRVLKRKTYGE